ncbi:MAG: trypsin-like serine protease [Proteobacteria bacterium]|nr:MAG: trypsin-like serine protease [Pseudomonadota bacterium]
MKSVLVALAFVFPFFTAQAGTPPPGTLNIPDLVERVDKGVVNIQAVTLVRERVAMDPVFEDFIFQMYGVSRERIRKQPSLGSGFVIDEEGYILTNNHVVERASEVEVYFDDGKKTRLKAKVIGVDKKADLALLQVKPGPYLRPLPLGNSDLVKVGESVVAIGNPFALSHTVTAGIISAKNRVIGAGPFDNFLQTDASINPGNSGGPLFSAAGEVIGINTAINAQGQGLGFAIPINQAKKMLPDLKKHGRVLRGWLGALLTSTPEGTFVDGVVLRSAAFKAGLKSGDRVVEVEGKKIEEQAEVERVLEDRRPGDTISFVVERDGAVGNQLVRRRQTYKVQLGEEPEGRELPRGLI